MHARLKLFILAGSGLLLGACEATLPDGGQLKITAPSASTAPASDMLSAETTDIAALAEPKTAPMFETQPAPETPTAAEAPEKGEEPETQAIPADRVTPMPVQPSQMTGKASGLDTPAADTDMPDAATPKESFDIAAGSLTPPPEPPAVPAAPKPAPPPPAEFEPASVIGLPAGQLERRFGDADLLRREGTAEVWQYRLTACVVDYFVYPDAAGIAMIVGWDWRAPLITAEIDPLQCRQDLAVREQATTIQAGE